MWNCLVSLADDQAGMDVDLASAVLAVDRRGVPRPWLADLAYHPTTLAPQASAFDVAALDAAEHLSVSVEEATADLAVATARCFLARVSVSGAVGEVFGVAAVARRDVPSDENELPHFKRQRRSRTPAHED